MTRSGKRQHKLHRSEVLDTSRSAGNTGISEPLTPFVFRGAGSYRIAGHESQQVYCFSLHDPEQMIEARDVDALLKSGFFRIRN